MSVSWEGWDTRLEVPRTSKQGGTWRRKSSKARRRGPKILEVMTGGMGQGGHEISHKLTDTGGLMDFDLFVISLWKESAPGIPPHLWGT